MSNIGKIDFNGEPGKKNEVFEYGPLSGRYKIIVRKGFGFKLSETFLTKPVDALGEPAESLITKRKEGIREGKQRLKEAKNISSEAQLAEEKVRLSQTQSN